MYTVCAPQTRCRAGLARADITPPVGIYHRMWGAALHDRATAVHRPLLATALWLEALAGSPEQRQLVLGLDHCILDGTEMVRIREAVSQATGLQPEQVQVALSHTHGSGWMSRTRTQLPGGELIGPYLDALAQRCAALAREAAGRACPATLVYGTGRCALAAHRDLWDPAAGRYVCGYNPGGSADDTLVVGGIFAGETRLGTLVNYACHPTTLAWENSALSPDYVGAMRALIEAATEAPCLFLQGASGDLGPREGYVGDPAVADRNGRQVGYAALAALEGLPPPGTAFAYRGAVVSGAVLGTWQYEPLDDLSLSAQATWQTRRLTVELAYRADLPTREETERQLAHWQEEEVRAADDGERRRECRARGEQMRRQLTRLRALPAGRTYPYTVTLGQLGAALWLFAPGELYQFFQLALRRRFPERAVIVATNTGDWQPGYLPTAATYGYGIYQEEIAAVAPDSLEVLLEAVTRAFTQLLTETSEEAIMVHAALAAVLQRLEHWLARHRRHYLKSLRPGASPAPLDALAKQLGVPLPEELRTLLAWHDGQQDDCLARFAQDWLLMSAEQIAGAKHDLDAEAAATGWQAAWVPFLDDDAGDYVCVDTSQPGLPVREFWLGNKTHPVVAPSLAAWLETFVADVEKGKYHEEPERGTFLKEE